MSHDLYASWATSELAKILSDDPSGCFVNSDEIGEYSMFASRESGRIWPIPDGRISIELQNNTKYEIALEMKRTNEGLHGILTAIGQSQAYLDKGYSASAIVIPEKYDTFETPGDYIARVMNLVNPNLSVGVYSYQPPDSTAPNPFRSKIFCHRPIGINLSNNVQAGNFLAKEKANTQWAHLREGSSEPHAFFMYLQLAKKYSFSDISEPNITFPQELIDACNSLGNNRTMLKYLSNSVGDTFHDLAWRNFWFEYVFHQENTNIFNMNGSIYTVDDVETKLLKNDGSNEYKKYWSGRANSKKNTLVTKLNEGTISENQAWEKFAENVRNRAHSYREDIDSGLEHLGLIEPDGKPSQLGYKFVDACERSGDSHTGIPKLILGNALLNNGNLAAFLHYVHRISEEELRRNPLSFTKSDNNQRIDIDEYLSHIRNTMANDLKVLNTASLRGGAARKPFQAEIAILRKFDFVGKFRLGVGLEINWPLINEYMSFEV